MEEVLAASGKAESLANLFCVDIQLIESMESRTF